MSLILYLLVQYANADFRFSPRFSQMPLQEKITYCESIDKSEYVSGLTDGNFIVPSVFGKTYYYRSYCYFELAMITADAKFCDLVIPRNSLLGNNGSITPKICREEVQKKQNLQAEDAKQSQIFKTKTQGLLKLNPAKITKLDSDSWELEFSFQGNLWGEYELSINNLNADFKDPQKTIFTKNINIDHENQIDKILLSRKTLESCSQCQQKPQTNIGIGLNLVKPLIDLKIELPVYSNVVNSTL